MTATAIQKHVVTFGILQKSLLMIGLPLISVLTMPTKLIGVFKKNTLLGLKNATKTNR